MNYKITREQIDRILIHLKKRQTLGIRLILRSLEPIKEDERHKRTHK